MPYLLMRKNCTITMSSIISSKFSLNFTGLEQSSTRSVPDLAVDIKYNDNGAVARNPLKDRPVITKDVTLANGRWLNTALDKEGMILSNHGYDHVNYYNDNEVISTYYRELENHVKTIVSGAKKVMVFFHQVRSWKDVNVNRDGDKILTKKPVLFSHLDYSADGARNRLLSLSEPPLQSDSWGRYLIDPPMLTKDEVEQYSTTGRYMILHGWRNICPDRPLQKNPLALCSANTVKESDLIAYDLCYKDHVQNVMMAKYHPDQKWLYYPDMHMDELLLFKQFDSLGSCVVNGDSECVNSDNGVNSNERQDAQNTDEQYINAGAYDTVACGVNSDQDFLSCYVPHTAFEDPGCDPCYPGRESIEAGILVLFD